MGVNKVWYSYGEAKAETKMPRLLTLFEMVASLEFNEVLCENSPTS